VDRHYDYKLIHSRLQSLMEAQENGDVRGLMYVIRSGLQLSRNNYADIQAFSETLETSRSRISITEVMRGTSPDSLESAID